MSAKIESIFLIQRPGGAPVRHASVRAVAGAGLTGDHHLAHPVLFGSPAPEKQLTLIEAEALEFLERRHGIRLGPGASRRNLVTRGVRLNALVGRTFQVGGVRARGVERCDPCAHLEALTQPGVLRGLVNRGGLRAEILTDGLIREGDSIEAEP